MIQVKQHAAPRQWNNVFDELFGAFPHTWSKEGHQQQGYVPANVYETNEGFTLELLVPGRQKEDFKVSIEKDLLTISYEAPAATKNEQVKTLRKEFGFKSFKRSFHLDEQIDTEAINARYDNGVLKFYLPKKEEVKVSPKAITVQ